MLDGVHGKGLDTRRFSHRRYAFLFSFLDFHLTSIYRDAGVHRARKRHPISCFACALIVAVLPLASTSVIGAPVITACSDVLHLTQPRSQWRLVTNGTNPVQTAIPISPGHEWLFEVRQRGNDARVEILDEYGRLLTQADHPERRTGTRRLILSRPASQSIVLRVVGKEHPAITGTADVTVFDLAAWSHSPDCLLVYRLLAAADSDYASAQRISLGQESSVPTSAREQYRRAALGYEHAQALLGSPADAALRGEVDLALAGVRYFDLQDWRSSAEWAATAEGLFAGRDSYRQARARALAAAAWIEIATGADSPGVGDTHAKDLFEKARRTFRDLLAFHSRRGEGYDAALQLNNIGLADLYEGRYRECIAAARSASRQFAQLDESPRQALASQNQALCHWGLGHLSEALGAFDSALKQLTPEPYPQLYLLTLNNTALINYALGHFDESLRLHDQALQLAIRSQNQREQAQSLYGLGVTYYALGDQGLARVFLERALEIRTAAFDGRGRQATLRSLATVYADLGEYRKAMAFDEEALALATAPTSRARSRIQLATHTSLAGSPEAALKILADLIDPGFVSDPLIRAQARLERAVIERRSGAYATALLDLDRAMPVFDRVGSVTDGFYVNLERGRVLRLAGQSAAALASVDQALQKSEAIRTQTANPEFRAQLQLPFRAAYDLKLDLLWETFERVDKAGKTAEAAAIAAEAFRSADSARARSFADVATQRYSSAIRQNLGETLAHRAALYRNLAGLRFALDSRLDRSGSSDPRARELESEIAGLQHEVDTLNNAISARTAAPVYIGPATRVSPTARMALPADAAIIAYWLGARSAYAWVATPVGVHWARLAEPESISAAAQDFHDALGRLADVPRERRLRAGADLYEKVIRPVSDWAAPYKRWFVIPDAALVYVPFAALRGDAVDDAGYIVETHDIALAPAAWLLLAAPHFIPATRGPPLDHARILLVSDPVYESSDPRLTVGRELSPPAGTTGAGIPIDQHQALHRIPGTAREARAVRAEFPLADVDSFSGLQATRERLLQLDWSRYRFIHIASHGHVDARMPQLSSLVLSAYDQNGARIEDALRAADLSALTLSAEVAVFSGCDTALGREVLSEGMIGIAYDTLARGAGAVVSSLWQVPDEIDATLMTEFYRQLVHGSMDPARALSAAMRSVVAGNPRSDPALWAAFQVSVVTMDQRDSL